MKSSLNFASFSCLNICLKRQNTWKSFKLKVLNAREVICISTLEALIWMFFNKQINTLFLWYKSWTEEIFLSSPKICVKNKIKAFVIYLFPVYQQFYVLLLWCILLELNNRTDFIQFILQMQYFSTRNLLDKL